MPTSMLAYSAHQTSAPNHFDESFNCICMFGFEMEMAHFDYFFLFMNCMLEKLHVCLKFKFICEYSTNWIQRCNVHTEVNIYIVYENLTILDYYYYLCITYM